MQVIVKYLSWFQEFQILSLGKYVLICEVIQIFIKKLRWIFHLMLAYIDNLLGVLSLFYWFVQLLRNSAELPRQKSRQSSPLPFVLHFFLLLFFCTARVSEDCNFPIVLSFFWFWFETCLIFRPVFANRTVHIIVRNLICSCVWYAYLLLYKGQVLFTGQETVFPYDWWFRGESVLRNFELTY